MNIEETIKKINEIKKEYATMDGLKEYVEAIDLFLTEYEKQQNRINKAIEYIKNCEQATLVNDADGIGFTQKIELLKILKGE